MNKGYRDFHLATGVSGYPTLALRNATTAVVGDWSGCLTLVDLDTGEVVRRGYVGHP